MKKIVFLCALVALTLSAQAQLPWETEMTKSDFENAQTVISKTENVSFSNPVLGIGGGLSIGKIVVFGTYDDECVIALSQTGIAEKLSFAWQGGSQGTFKVYQSSDHNNWSVVFETEGNTIALDKSEEVTLSTSTRYLKFAASAKTAIAVRKIKVTELRTLSASTDEWPFGSAMVDDADAVKQVTVTWTNIVASVSSTDPHFTTSLTTIGEKNKIDQTTVLTISYTHNEAGNHSGEIVISGEEREVRIAVSGSTAKYDQTLTWNQTLSECLATDKIILNGFTSSGLPVQYHSSDSTVAYVEDGIISILQSGEVTITAKQAGNYKYNAANEISQSLTIKKADPEISVSAEDLVYGQSLSEAVLHENLGKVAGTLSWYEADPASVLDAGNYVLSVLFTPDNTGIYNTRTMPVALHIDKAPQTVIWDEQTTDLTVGVSLASTAVLSSGLTLTYAYTACLLTIEDGIIMPEEAGEVTVIAYHAGNENYLPTTTVMQTFHITGGVPSEAPEQQLTEQQLRNAAKFLHNGKVFVSYEGKVYDADGKLVK